MLRSLVALLILVPVEGAPALSAGRVVAVDQIGYAGTARKYAFTSRAADSFSVVSTATGESVLRGPLNLWKSADPATGHAVYRGDFSPLQTAGMYRIVTSGGDSSSAFAVNDSVDDTVYRKALKGYFFQRCGMGLTSTYAGAYQRVACHSLDGVFHSTTDTTGFHNATGGWHDAGDYGKYVVNAGISAGTLLLGYEMFPDRFGSDDLGIPESGNGVPDILDEVRYELEWVMKMQRSDGGVWFKLTREQFEGFIMPQYDTGTRYLYEVSSAATGDATAVLAMAARLYAPFDAAFARRCLAAAQLGWQFLSSHPTIVPAGGFKNPAGTATGEYGDADDTDERLWAAGEIFESTGDTVCHSYFTSAYQFGSVFGGSMWWGDVRPLALLTYMRSIRPAALASVKTELRQGLVDYCAAQVSKRNDSGYQVVLAPGEYVWGSNSSALNAAVLLIAGFTEAQDTAYAETAADQLHYVLGANGLSRSFVTGLGEHPPRQPHHRPSASDGIADPVPGLMAGGPNQYLQDPVLQALFTGSTPPALCYADSTPSYASNEIAINWNAPLVFVSGYFRGGGQVAAVEDAAPPHSSRYFLEQNYPNPFNPKTEVRYQVAEVSTVRLAVYDLLGREVATLVNERKGPGEYEVAFDGSSLASGVYICRLAVRSLDFATGGDSGSGAGVFVAARKLLLVR